MRKFVLLVVPAVLMMTCSRDNRNRLFEMIYPNIQFEIPAGLPGGQVPQALVLDDQPTRYNFFLQQNNVSDARVSAIRSCTTGRFVKGSRSCAWKRRPCCLNARIISAR